jgi:putative copper export protein
MLSSKSKPMTKISVFLLTVTSAFAYSQEDLLKDIDTISTATTTAPQAFKVLQIVTGQSTKLTTKNKWYVVIAHRFGDVSSSVLICTVIKFRLAIQVISKPHKKLRNKNSLRDLMPSL